MQLGLKNCIFVHLKVLSFKMNILILSIVSYDQELNMFVKIDQKIGCQWWMREVYKLRIFTGE